MLFEQQLGGQIFARCLHQPSSFASHEPWGKEGRAEAQFPGSVGKRHKGYFLVALWKIGKAAEDPARQSTARRNGSRREAINPLTSWEGHGDNQWLFGGGLCCWEEKSQLQERWKGSFVDTEQKWWLSLLIHLKSERDLSVGGKQEFIVSKVLCILGEWGNGQHFVHAAQIKVKNSPAPHGLSSSVGFSM